MITPDVPVLETRRLAPHTIVALLVVLSGVLWVGLAIMGVAPGLAVVGAVFTVIGGDRLLDGRVARSER